MIQALKLSKGYGDQVLLDEVDFSMGRKERLGLVGRNGTGKSTLFRLLLGEDQPDSGTLNIPRGYRIGHLAQHLEFHEPTILAEACLGLAEDERDQEYRAEIILAGLGFSQDDMSRPPSAFSGGFQIRLNLAKLLLSEPNLLLLDEPTNYLDIVSMRWLRKFLCAWKHELIIISHDRSFMDSVTTHTMVIHRGKIRKIAGGTEKLYQQIAQDEEIYEKTRINEAKKRQEMEDFIARFRAQAAKASLVQSKMKMLARMGEKEELAQEQNLAFEFVNAPFEGRQMLEVNKLSFAYPGGSTLIRDLSLAIRNGDRIGVIGKNGKGKSTLLRLLANDLTPSVGSVSVNQNARVGYFGQTNILRLDPKLTVEQEIDGANPKLHRTAVRTICGIMMFSGDDALKKVGVLSGGERSRVLLGKILAQPSNVLLLDEPTNHLDIPSIEALIDSLRNYKGAVVIVTHSELILKELATRLVVFRGDAPEIIEGGYDEFLERGGWGDEEEMSSSGSPSGTSNAAHAVSPEKRKAQLEKHLASVTTKITALNAEQKQLERELEEEGADMSIDRLTELSEKLAGIGETIEDHSEDLKKTEAELTQLTLTL